MTRPNNVTPSNVAAALNNFQSGTKWYFGDSIIFDPTEPQQLYPIPYNDFDVAKVDSVYSNAKTSTNYRCVEEGTPETSRWVLINGDFDNSLQVTLDNTPWNTVHDYFSSLFSNNPDAFHQYKFLLTKDVSGFKYRIIGVNHDKDTSGNTVFLTWQSVDCIANHQMNTSNTTTGGFPSSAMFTYFQNELFNSFPGELKNSIIQVKKQYSATSKGAISNYNSKIFLLTEKEVFGTTNYDNSGTWYEWYSTHNTANDRIKKYNNSAQYWWLTSVYSSSYFATVSTSGALGYNSAVSSGGVAPCFCI